MSRRIRRILRRMLIPASLNKFNRKAWLILFEAFSTIHRPKSIDVRSIFYYLHNTWKTKNYQTKERSGIGTLTLALPTKLHVFKICLPKND